MIMRNRQTNFVQKKMNEVRLIALDGAHRFFKEQSMLKIGLLCAFSFIVGYMYNNQTTKQPNNLWLLPIIDYPVDLALILQEEKKSVGLEIGVKQGDFATAVLSRWTNCEMYYLVDPWAHQANYSDHANVAQNVQNEFFDQTKEKLHRFEERGTELVYLREYSSTAVDKIPDNSLDFIYVDARHDFQSVSEDLRLYWPKLKNGGILSGGDFVNADEEPWPAQDWCTFADGTKCENNQAVKAAVEVFAKKHAKQIIIPRRETVSPSWYLRK